MYKKIINFTIIIFILLLFFISFKNYNVLTYSLIDTSLLFIKNVFPFLFISIFINNLLIECNLPYFFYKIFHNKYLYIFIMSILSGAPNNAVIISNYLDKKIINEKDASIILSFTTFNSPLFLYHYFNKIFHIKKIIYVLFLFIYLSNVLLLIIYYKKLSKNDEEQVLRKINFLNSIPVSIKKSINSIIYIYATILLFKIICDLILPKYSLLRGFIEITMGLNIISIIYLPIKIKELLVLVILSFGGLSIHIQISSILSNYNINYRYFYTVRVILILISMIILIF